MKPAESSPLALLRRLFVENPDLDEDQLSEKFMVAVADNGDCLRSLVASWCKQRLKAIKGDGERQDVSREVSAIKTRLLDMLMPDGKKLRDATFADCRRAGGFFFQISAKGKPNEVVGQKLCEDDLLAIWKKEKALKSVA